MSTEITEKYAQIIENSAFIWFTTVRADGMPQPTPVWFVRDGDTFLIYTTPGSQKAKNLRGNSQVALGLSNEYGGDVFIVQGEAAVDDTAGLPTTNKLYYGKYESQLPMINMTPESFDATFTVPIRITPKLIRSDI